jgi:hypothetical protein
MKNCDYPKSYWSALTALGREQERVIGVATRLYRDWWPGHDQPVVKVRYHATDVVTWYPDGRLVLDHGHWLTLTTTRRMNDCLPGHAFVYRRNGTMLLGYHDGQGTRHDVPFTGHTLEVTIEDGRICAAA